MSGDLLYDKEVYKLLNDHQEDTDNLMVVVFDDHGSQKREMSSDTDRSAYVFPVSWSGVPTSNPTNALITTSVEFLLNGEAVDGGVISPAKTRAREICTLKAGTGPAHDNTAVYEDMLGGASPTGFFSARATDRVFLVVSKWVSATSSGKDIALQTAAGVAITEPISVTRPGIYEWKAKASQNFGDLMKLDIPAPNTNLLRGWVVAGSNMTID